MSVKIRLTRHGRKKIPFYRVIVADSRSPRDGRFIEQLGTYDPMKDPGELIINEEATLQWLKQGAQPSETVRGLLKSKSGVWEKFRPGEGKTLRVQQVEAAQIARNKAAKTAKPAEAAETAAAEPAPEAK